MKLPKGWEVKRLGDLGDALIGLTYTPADVAEEGTRVLRSSNIQNGAIVYGDDVYVRGTVPPKCLVQPGDILICARNGSRDLIGKSATITPNQKGDAFGAFMAVYRSQEHRFIFQLLKTEAFRRQVSENLGATINSLTNSVLLRLSFLFPPEGEREKIADILGTWDEALEKLDTLIAAKARRKQALMQQLLTGHRRLPGFSKPWKRVELSEVAEECSIRNGQKLDRTRLYAVTKAEGMVPMRENVQGATINRCLIVARGWFAYNPMRINIGSIARWEHVDPVMVSPDYVVFRTNESLLLSDYLNHVRRAALWSDFVGAAGNGSVRIRIWFDDLGYFEFPLPPIAEQRAIAAVLDTADAELRLLRQQRTALDHQKRGLMQQLLTGRIRVAAP